MVKRIEDFLVQRTIDRARRNANRGNYDFTLSHAVQLLGGDVVSRALNGVGQELSSFGYSGHIYVEQADIGNGNQDLTRPRVTITGNGEDSFSPRYAKKLENSTVAILEQFPNPQA